MKTNHFLSLAAMLCAPLFFSCSSDINVPPPPRELSSSSDEQSSSSSLSVDDSSSSNVGKSSSSSIEGSSSSNLVLADCGGGYYNPATHFCVGNSFYEKCNGLEYNIETEMCDKRDQKIYKFAKIGGKAWMIENLNYSGNNTLGYCYDADIFAAEHKDLETCNDRYGRLYRWAEVSANLPQSLCPEGWHIPKIAEWQSLDIGTLPNTFFIYSGNYNSNPKWTVGWGDRGDRGFYWTSNSSSDVAMMDRVGKTKLVLNSDASTADIFSVRCVKN